MKNFSEKIMNSDSNSNPGIREQQELLAFARKFLKINGAVVEQRLNLIEVLAPAELTEKIETPDHFFIVSDTGEKTPQNLLPDSKEKKFRLNFGSPLLEKMVNLVCGRVPVVTCRPAFEYIKTQGFDKLIKDTFKFYDSVGNVVKSARVQTRYIFLTCRFLAQSDEQQEGLLNLVFNIETGASVPQMADVLNTLPLEYKSEKRTQIINQAQAAEILKQVKQEIRNQMAHKIKSFRQSMNRRFIRDVANLEAYYEDLKEEMKESLKRPGLSKQLVEERKEKIEMIPRELNTKKDDLFKKYSIRVKVEPCTAIIMHTEAVKILYSVSIGKKKKNVSIIYNPITKSPDPIVCQGCQASTFSLSFCKNFHMVCSSCKKNCPLCFDA